MSLSCLAKDFYLFEEQGSQESDAVPPSLQIRAAGDEHVRFDQYANAESVRLQHSHALKWKTRKYVGDVKLTVKADRRWED